MDAKLLFLLFLMHFGLTISASVEFNKNLVDFSFDLYNKISKSNPNENVIISPLSVETGVGLVYMGAGGETADEIVKVLRFGNSEKSTVGTNFQELLNFYKDGKFVKIVNKIYVGKNLVVQPEFNEIAENQFYSKGENIDFEKSDIAAETINKWVEDKTNNRITNLISPKQIDEDTRMILVNAIHFIGEWEIKFFESGTRKKKFHISETEQVKVKMMSKLHFFKYSSLDDIKAIALEMDYKDSDLSMLFILPNEIEGLAEVEDELLTKNLLDISNKMQIKPVFVSIPIFKIESTFELNETLISLGLSKMFTDSADFSNLSSEPLKVSKVIHKAFIEINEEGTEAAAATGFSIPMRTSGITMPSAEIFTADHPFFFALKSKSNIIFSGKYVKNK